MKTDATSRALIAAKRLCEEKLLIHRVPDAEKPLDHASDCPACALREALAKAGILERESRS